MAEKQLINPLGAYGLTAEPYKIVASFPNNEGATIARADAVELNFAAGFPRVQRATGLGDVRVLGIAEEEIPDTEVGMICVYGFAEGRLLATAAAVAGDRLVASATAGRLAVLTTETFGAVIGFALEAEDASDFLNVYVAKH